jgi:hypothetical protein
MAKVKLTKTTTSDPLVGNAKRKTYVGFSTVNRDFDSNTLYDYELARTDLLNAFYIKKGEKLELPNYGTIIHDTLFDTLRIDSEEYGLNLSLEITYVPYSISESLTLAFNQESGLEVTSNPVQVSESQSVGSAGASSY